MMKRVLAILLAMVMLFTMGILALATGSFLSKENVYPGEVVSVYGFYTADGETLPEGDLNSKYYTVSASWRRGGNYIDRVYIDDSSQEVKILVKSGVSVSSEKVIEGSVTVREVEGRDRRRYIADVSMTLGGGGSVQMIEVDVDSFELPEDYQSKKVRFVTESGEKIGTLRADFHDSSYNSVAYFNVRVIEQAPLFLGHNNAPDVNLIKKNEAVNLRFLSWGSAPTFDVTGTLGIYCNPDDYVYSRQADGTLIPLGGTYNQSTGAYEIRTKTLGSYVISDRALSMSSGSVASSSFSSSSSTESASSSSSVAPPPSSSSSVASSSVPPSASTVSSSSSSGAGDNPVVEVPSSSQGVSMDEAPSNEAPASEESSQPASSPQEETEENNSFPLIPIVVGALILVVIVLAVVLMDGKNRSGYDDWDD